MNRWDPRTPLAAVWKHLDAYARKPEGTSCPACRRKVKYVKRRINQNQAETFVAICRETFWTRSQSAPRPWIHVERDLVRKGLAPLKGRDWTLLKFWGLIEPKPDLENPGGHKAGLWRVTDFGLEVFRNPRRLLLFDYVETFDNTAKGRGARTRSLVSCLGRAFDFEEEIRRAS